MNRIWIFAGMLAVVIVGSVWGLWPQSNRGLVLYSAVDYGSEVSEAFKKATGIKVTTMELSTGALLAKVSAEGHRPAWTMAWFDGDQAAASLDKSGLLLQHAVPELPWTKLGLSLIPADGSYTPTGMTLAGVFTYKTGTFAEVPVAWPELTQGNLRGAIGMNNPAISGPMYPLLAGMLEQGGGWPQGKAFVMALKNNGLHIYTKNSNTLAALKTGDIKIAVIQSSAAWHVAASDHSFHVNVPKPSFALPSVLVVSAGVSVKERAEVERFIRFAMSHDIQHLRILKGEADGYYWPITTDAPKPMKILPDLDSLTVKVLNPELWGSLEPQINRWFSKDIVGQ